MDALPVIARAQLLAAFVASTVYVPAAVCSPNDRPVPVPDTALPTAVPLLYSLYCTPACEPDSVMNTPLPPAQYAPPPNTFCVAGSAFTTTVAIPTIAVAQPVSGFVACTL